MAGKTNGADTTADTNPTPDPGEDKALEALRGGFAEAGLDEPAGTRQADLGGVGAGDEIDEDIEDDAERDARLAREAAGGGAKPDGGTASGATPAAKVPAAATPAAAADDAAAEAERVAALDQEADTLNLKGKSRARFHELANALHERDQRLAALEPLVGRAKDDTRDTVDVVAERLQTAQQFEDAIFSLGATADQFQQFGSYMTAIQSRDPQAWESAAAFLRQELAWLEGPDMLGVRAPDGKDLLEDFPELAEKVRTGAMDREDAEELARYKARERTTQRVVQATAAETAEIRTAEQGQEQCVTFAATTAAQDPARWQAVWPTLEPQVRRIQTAYKPSEWATQVELAFHRIPYAPAAPSTVNGGGNPRPGSPRPGRVDPVRSGRPAQPTGGRQMEQQTDDPMEALRQGIESVPGQRR